MRSTKGEQTPRWRNGWSGRPGCPGCGPWPGGCYGSPTTCCP